MAPPSLAPLPHVTGETRILQGKKSAPLIDKCTANALDGVLSIGLYFNSLKSYSIKKLAR